jgi:hypothetical protein
MAAFLLFAVFGGRPRLEGPIDMIPVLLFLTIVPDDDDDALTFRAGRSSCESSGNFADSLTGDAIPNDDFAVVVYRAPKPVERKAQRCRQCSPVTVLPTSCAM